MSSPKYSRLDPVQRREQILDAANALFTERPLLDGEVLEPRVDPDDEPRDPLEVVALGAVEHTMQQLLERLRAKSTETACVEPTETGAVGEPVILRRVVATTDGARVSNGEGRKATIRPRRTLRQLRWGNCSRADINSVSAIGRFTRSSDQ